MKIACVSAIMALIFVAVYFTIRMAESAEDALEREFGIAGLLGRLDEGPHQRVHRSAFADGERALSTVELVFATLVRFCFDKIGQHGILVPARSAALRPAVIVRAITSDIDHGVH